MTKRNLALAVALAALGAAWTVPAAAQESAADEHASPDEHTLGETVVTATRIAEPRMKIPANVTVITAKDLEKRHAFSLRDALTREAGIYVAPTADVKDGVMLRGFSGADILVMYNGQMLNTAFDGGVNWDSIPLTNIDRIEIVRGAGSSLYGGHAVAGVINIITKKPPASEETKPLEGLGLDLWRTVSAERRFCDVVGTLFAG